MYTPFVTLFTSVSWVFAILQRDSSEWGKCLFKFTASGKKTTPFYCWCTSFFLMGRKTSEQEKKFFKLYFSEASTFPLYSFQHVGVCIYVARCTCNLSVCVCVCVCDSLQPLILLFARTRSITIFFIGKSILHMISPLSLPCSAQP